MADKKLIMKLNVIIILLFFSLLIIPQIRSQETNDVCFIHFTEQNCPNCLTIDAFMENMTQIYNNTMVITYDLSLPGNEQVFNLYRQKYGIYRYLPSVLFGKYDFLISMDDIRAGLEKRIIHFTTQDGNECPMVDGTTTPPNDIGEGTDLPGEPAVIAGDQVGEIPQDSGEEYIIPGDEEGKENGGNQIIGIDDITNAIENITNPQSMEDYLIIAAIFIIVILFIVLVIVKMGKGRKKRKK
ncbi:MAG: hypothetical protein JW754_00160 [Candidatus Aenigmarchaeota archaeon]|nr:hypothetical protein [Candidatus Aenigmarchaeota archaeon]